MYGLMDWEAAAVNWVIMLWIITSVCGASGIAEGYDDKYYFGRRPNGIYIPRFQNVPGDTKKRDYLRGFGYQGACKPDQVGSGKWLN